MMQELLAFYQKCLLCPHECGVNRLAEERGRCGETAALRIAAASIHRGEEPPITERGGSGTVFVSGCNLGCAFCQNAQISREGIGRTVNAAEFADVCMALQQKGAENINIVTGSHAIPALILGIQAARARGLTLPVLWNSSAYESPRALSLLEGVIDGWLPDLKTLDAALAGRFFNAPGYGEAAKTAIRAMLDIHSRAPAASAARLPVIIRHLVLPALLESTREVLVWFAKTRAEYAAKNAPAPLLSLMTQYTPVGSGDIPRRPINHAEYETVLDWLDELGIEDGFYQELVADSDWLPDFTRENPFSSDLSTPVWHWKTGFVDG
jgi:putative pyruvate formate lyase activating enzyme